MPYLDTYQQLLTERTAAHLLRRATFGPTQNEISNFAGLTATQAVQILINNADFNTPEPVDLDSSYATKGQPFVNINPFNGDRNFFLTEFIKQWWIGLMVRQNPTTLLDKLTLFWQNHFVTSASTVEEYRFVYRYIHLLRNNALGNYRDLIKEITKDPAMLFYLNGNDNVKGSPNENYARELQELFSVGEKDFYNNKNYTENDVKEAARVLTGWKYIKEANQYGSRFEPIDHDETNKTFSSYYNNTIITGRTGINAGELELNDLITMLLNHSHTPKYICRKLYKWFINPIVTEAVENNFIIPLAQFFSSPSNNYAIQPVIEKLLTCEHFYDQVSIGAIIKSPVEFMIGLLRFFNFPLPPATTTNVDDFRNYTFLAFVRMKEMQMEILTQPSVFGYEPYYQTGFSEVWINSSSLALRSAFAEALVYGYYKVNDNYRFIIDFFGLAASATTPNSALSIVQRFTKNLFATELNATQIDFLVDTIMMNGVPRLSWKFEYEAYLADPNNPDKRQQVLWRLQPLMKYLLRMAEFQIF